MTTAATRLKDKICVITAAPRASDWPVPAV
jgi:hypothetical protein